MALRDFVPPGLRFDKQARMERRSHHLDDNPPGGWTAWSSAPFGHSPFWGLSTSPQTSAGKWVTPENALTVATVYACVRLLANSVGMLPFELFVRSPAGGAEQLPNDPYYDLLSVAPNPEQTASEFWRLMMVWQLLRGNAYAYMQSDGAGRVTALWPLPADLVQPVRTTTHEMGYRVKLLSTGLDRAGDLPTDQYVGLAATEVLHFKALALGPVGISPIALARQAIGLSMSAEEYGARFFRNDARPGGVIQVPKVLSDKEFQRLKLQWNSQHQGAQNAHLAAVLEGGATWVPSQMTNEDAEFLSTRKFAVAEIARIFGVPPHMVGDVDRSTSWGTGIEQQGLGYVIFSLLPWLRDFETVVQNRLLRPQNKSYFARFNVRALLRGDMLTRNQSFAIQREWGVINADEWRQEEDRNPIADGSGKVYLAPLNYAPASGTLAKKQPAPPSQPAPLQQVASAVAAVDRRAIGQRIERDEDGNMVRLVYEYAEDAVSLNGHGS